MAFLLPLFSYDTAHATSSKSPPLSTTEEIHAAFPESYWEGIDALKAQHPNWKFVAFNTGLTWERVFESDAEAYPSRNLAYGYVGGKLYFPTSWYSTDIPGSYNWAANNWTKYDNGSWLQASKDAIAYCMDPRNFLDEVQVFQFLDTAAALDPVDAEKAIKTILKSEHYMQTGEQADLYDIIDDEGIKRYLTFPQALAQIGAELGLNQITLASRLYQENSGGNSPLVTGTREFSTEDGKVIPGGYYNYFNIGASGNSNGAIIENGLQTAYKCGWDTRYKSLKGGAEEIMKFFVNRGQTTTYSQKFSVDSSSSRLFWGQYMQNITAPQTESQNVYKAFVAADALDTDLTFIIPIFENMPDECPRPEKDGNPNYKLGSIYIDGESIANFNTDTLEYSWSTDESSIRINALAYANTTTISYIDPANEEAITQTGKLKNTINLNTGKNEIELTCTAENGDVRVYKLIVTSTYVPESTEPEEEATTPPEPTDPPQNNVPETDETEPPTEQPTEPPKGETEETQPETQPPVTEPEETTPETQPSEPTTPPVEDEEEDVITPGKYLDANQDGEWDIFDVAVIYSHILGTTQLEDWQFELCDVNHDGTIDIFDASVIYQHILGHIKLKAVE